jgi:hypothetical protein
MPEKDIYQLRQLIEARLAQKLPDMREACIVTSGLILDFAGLSHRAKLQNFENAVVSSGTRLQEKNRKARFDYDR